MHRLLSGDPTMTLGEALAAMSDIGGDRTTMTVESEQGERLGAIVMLRGTEPTGRYLAALEAASDDQEPTATITRGEAQAQAIEQAANDLYDALGLTPEALAFLAKRADQHRAQGEEAAS